MTVRSRKVKVAVLCVLCACSVPAVLPSESSRDQRFRSPLPPLSAFLCVLRPISVFSMVTFPRSNRSDVTFSKPILEPNLPCRQFHRETGPPRRPWGPPPPDRPRGGDRCSAKAPAPEGGRFPAAARPARRFHGPVLSHDCRH